MQSNHLSERQPVNPDRVEQIFHDALEVSDEARARLLDDRCGGDASLRRSIEQLLRASEEIEHDAAWQQPAIVAEAKLIAQQERSAELDRYRLLEMIGSGGMGVVYKAARTDDSFSKLVAVKIVHTGASDDRNLDRFRQERQILAGLEHPNIARLLDGGVTSDGLPFLAMEYVEGLPLDRYIAEKAEQKPDLDSVLDLFRKICAAVSYAHRNLIVHRDLKPSNILVTAEGEPKLLDFGVAKLLDGSTAATKTGHAAMTPEYASPEQIRGLPITTASDIYSLGVLLFEMLSGERPYRATTGALDLAQAIATNQPESLASKSGRQFDTDLENILQKALSKEPEQRYATVDQFSDDIQRYRDGYPVTARPVTRTYQLRKFVGRNKAAVGAAVLAILAVLIGGVATWRQARIADRRFNDVRRLANSYLFEFHDAIKDLPGATPARQLVVKRAIEFLDNLSKESRGNVELGREVATAYEKIADIQGGVNVASMGDQAGALATHRRALAIRKELAAAAPSNLDIVRELAMSYAEVGWYSTYRGDLSGVDDLRKSAALGERVLAARPNDPKVREALAICYTALGDVLGNPNYQNIGDTKGAVDFYRKGLAFREKLVSEDPKNLESRMLLASSSSRLGQLLQAMDDKPGAVAAYRRAADISDALKDEHPGNARFQREAAAGNRNLAWSLVKMGSMDEARERGDRSMELFEQIARDDPKNAQAQVETAEGYYSQGYVRSQAGEDQAALKFFNTAVSVFETVAAAHPADPPRPGLRTTYQLLSDLTLKMGDSAAAIRNAQHELEIDDRLLKTNLANASAERNQGLAMRQIAKAHEFNGMKAAPKATRTAELREAQSWYHRSLAIFESQKAKGTLIPMYASELENTPRAIARCDKALADLGSR